MAAMRPSLSVRVFRTIRRHRMLRPGDQVGIAVSGGGDSVALLLLFLELQETLGVRLRVLHFNHLLRGATAQRDEEFTRTLASERGLEFLLRREDVRTLARSEGQNLEATGRARRYAWFHELVETGRMDHVATGHTADDQAETVLARLARGTGLRGLGAIHPVRGAVMRPLLDLRRQELRGYLTDLGQVWVEDESNLDANRLRTRIRHTLLPMFEGQCGAAVTRNLTRLADLARADEALLKELADARFRALALVHEGRVTLKAADLLDPWPKAGSSEAKGALAARLVRRAVDAVKGDLKRLAADHVDRVLRLAGEGASGDRVEMPAGVVAERRLDEICLFREEEGKRTSPGRPSYQYGVELETAGEVVVPIAETHKRLRLKLIDWPAAGRETYPEAGALDADRLELPLMVRNWRPGDAYRPHGRASKEKLKRLLLEFRIDGIDRAGWPVLTSAGKPVWAEGLAPAAECALGAATKRALVVQVTKDGFRKSGGRVPAGAAKESAAASKRVDWDLPGRRGVATGPERGRT